MDVVLGVRNDSVRKQLYRRDVLRRLAAKICEGEGIGESVEISLMFCDDPFIASLNQTYRSEMRSTDVLSFEQSGDAAAGRHVLGDIVISLETAERNCNGDRRLMREEVAMLFCHGLLHLLGYDHGTAQERTAMNAKQAHYLGVSHQTAWLFGPKKTGMCASATASGGGSKTLGR